MRIRQTVRTITAAAFVPAMVVTGFRFSKLYRNEVTRFHRAVYRLVDVVAANLWAGIELPPFPDPSPTTKLSISNSRPVRQ